MAILLQSEWLSAMHVQKIGKVAWHVPNLDFFLLQSIIIALQPEG
jgi:hypothetical protein